MMSSENVGLYEKVKGVNSVIRILGAPNNSTPGQEILMEELDANSVETFTLDEFRSIILECRSKDVDFIVARVTTPDPYDQSTLYNFYYAGSEINRVLFRFETDRRLLHRMKVRNPLNNMYILGQVYYYKITVDEIDKAIVDYYFRNSSDEKRKNKLKAFSAVFRSSSETQKKIPKQDSITKDANDSICSSSSWYVDSPEEKNPKEIIEKIRKGDIQLGPITEDKLLVYNAYYFANDDDFLMHTEIREYFRRNTLDKDDDFLFEIDRTQNDFFALLESGEEEENEEVIGWKRILSAHVSLLITLLGVCLLLGTGPLVVLIALPLALVLFLSFMSSIVYILFCRQNTFDTLAVQSIEEV
ncbi:hypothetical protein NGRA_0349 [Nosema granulosis]|uniref:Golgi protein n=1 Tax=Nosema granulosis TaxID=83296 RepID=A0A9P6H0H7_9MICR|nr:hypothetical protein NGRA_0349 [Nosema granulosis]